MSKAGDFLRKIKLGKIVKGLVREGLQTLPVIGTVITNLKTDTPENPKGKLNLEAWDIYRLVIGLAVGFVLYKGLLNMEQIDFILAFIGIG